MTLSKPKSGGWAANELLTSSEMNLLQDELVKAVDGVDGGTYTLTAILVFAGFDVQFSSTARVLTGGSMIFDVGSSLAMSGTMTIAGTGIANMLGASTLNLAATSRITLTDDAKLQLNTDTAIELVGNAAVNVEAGCNVTFESSSLLDLKAGSLLLAQTSAEIRLDRSTALTVSGSTLTDFRLPLVPVNGDGSSGQAFEFTPPDGWIQRSTAGSAHGLVVPLRVSAGDVLDEITLSLNGSNLGFGAGHGATLPSVQVTLEVIRVGLAGGAIVVATLEGTAGSAAAYDATHTIVLSAMAHTVIATEAYYVRVLGEEGAGAVIDTTRILSIVGKIQLKSISAANQSL